MSDGSAWQYQVKLRKQAEIITPAREVALANTLVASIRHDSASRFIAEYEWLGNIGSAQHCFGLSADAELLAVACYTRAVSPTGFARLLPGVSADRVFQLCRGASAPHAPKWAGSHLISSSLRLLHKKLGAELVFAYADPRAGEVGIVYQAANAVYLGMTDARGPGEYVINGVRMNPRSVFRRFGSAAHQDLLKVDPFYTRIQRAKKHRYTFILAHGRRRKELVQMLAPLVQIAPKRANGKACGDFATGEVRERGPKEWGQV